jgi:ubiquinone/menaquinone biosynthesis C-methylase UbiE
MDIKDKRIDEGKAFDWGRTSEEYAKFRDIYPDEFYRKIADLGLCVDGQEVLDLGTGTGVLPRFMYKYGAKWTGTDISPEQIEQAKILAKKEDKDIGFIACSTEDLDLPDNSFDVITACQCFWYFDHDKVSPMLSRLLRPGGKLVILYMAWLPDEDKIAGESEKLILKFNPSWSGGREYRHPINIPEVVYEHFDLKYSDMYDLKVPFTKETWHGRVRASRGIGASLDKDELRRWDEEHRTLLDRIAPDSFDVLHYAAIAVLERR